MSKTSQSVSHSLLQIDNKVRKCYETQVRTFSTFDNRFLGNLIQTHKIKNILDVGCGEGSFILNLATVYPQLTIKAVETVPSLVAECKNRQINQNISNIEFQNTLFDEHYSQSGFDLITARFAVEHMQNPPYFFACSYQHLKADGLLGITEYCVMTTGVTDSMWLEFRKRELKLYQYVHSHAQISFEIPSLLQKSGFRNITSQFCQVSPSTVEINDFYDLVDAYTEVYSELDPLDWPSTFVSDIHHWTKAERLKPTCDPMMWLTQTLAQK